MDNTLQRPNSIFPVLLVNFIGMLGYSLIIPFFVFLVKKFGGNEFIYGIVGSIYPAFQLVGAPLLGRWSDQIGRKKVLMISQIGTFAAWILFIVALMLPIEQLMTFQFDVTGSFFISLPLIVLVIARALDGLTGGNVSVANAYLSDVSTNENRKGNFGKMASSTSLGFIIGPALAGLLGATIYGELIPVLAAALISLLAILVIYWYLPESRPSLVSPNLKEFSIRKLFKIEQRECYEMEHCPDTGLRGVLRVKHIPILYLFYFTTFLGFSFYYVGFPVYAAGDLGWNSFQLGLYLTVSSLIMVNVQGPVLTYLSARVPDSTLVLIGSSLFIVCFLLLPTGTIFSVYAANVALSVGNGLMWPSFLSILSKSGTPTIQGTIQGYANSMGSLASILGLIFGGVLFSQMGPDIFYGAAFAFFLLTLLAFRLVYVDRQLSATQ